MTGWLLAFAGQAHLEAVRLSEPVAIDGVLTEAVWQTAPVAGGFTQRDPSEGAPATETTDVRFAYDDDAFYVAARLHDSQPKQIVARLGRRDAWLEADAFVLFVDGYHDGRSGLFFSVNAAGTLRDGTLYNDDWDDDSWSLGTHGSDYARQSDWYRNGSLTLTWRPGSNFNLSLEPRYEVARTAAQYIDSFDDPLASDTYGHRYLFGRLEQKTFSAGIRLNWTFTPRLSLQLYLQPLLASGTYRDFGDLARPRSYEFARYADVSLADDVYTADPDGPGPAPAVTFDDPDFDLHSLRVNAVLRWEFRPGSTAYFVWTQNRVDEETTGEIRFGRSFSRLFHAESDNVLLVKLAWRFGT